jgi:hypothetical protein
MSFIGRTGQVIDISICTPVLSIRSVVNHTPLLLIFSVFPVPVSPPAPKHLVGHVLLNVEATLQPGLFVYFANGQRSGAWQKMRVNQGQEFVIAGYTPSSPNFDAIVFGYYDAGRLIYAGRTRNGFTPSFARLFKYFKGLEVEKSPSRTCRIRWTPGGQEGQRCCPGVQSAIAGTAPVSREGIGRE